MKKLFILLCLLIPVASIAADIDYYTCPMHPQIHSDNPGQCPICGMDLVPVYRENKNQSVHEGHAPSAASGVEIDPSYVQRIGVTTARVELRPLNKIVRTGGKIAHDPELWVAENEYLEALRLENPDLVQAAATKLAFMGLSPEWIARLRNDRNSARTLHLPGKKGPHYVEAYLYQGNSDAVKVGQAVSIEDNQGKRLATGTVAAVGSVLDMETRTLRVLVSAPEPFHLKPNAFVQVAIEVPLGEAPSVPYAAVILNGDHAMVYVVSANGAYVPTKIELGERAGEFYAVTSGLSPGDQVVSNGHFLLDSETQIRLGSMGHQH